jgi:hypothetical protein
MPDAPNSRRTLLLLAALFFVPLAAAFILYYGVGWRPAGGTNNGELLQPLRQMPPAAESLLRGPTKDAKNWVLIYVGDGKCDEDCRRALVLARQTRLSLNKDMTRVNLAFLATGNCCDVAYIDKEHPRLIVRDVSEPEVFDQLMAVLPQEDLRHWLLIIDPLGNIVMRFDVRKEPSLLLKDLKKLLKLSHIG